MRKYLLLVALAVLIAAACNLPSALATSQSPVSDGSPSAVPPAVNSESPTGLVGTTWTWIGFTSPSEQLAVESSAGYSLIFQQDGSVIITADCNHGRGIYQVQGQFIQMQLGAFTEAKCSPGSRSEQFLQYLVNAATYSLQEGSLFIELNGNGGTLVFSPAETAAVGSEAGAVQQALQANPWQWTGFASPAGQYDVESPGDYLLIFRADGTVEIKADCNSASGTYAMDSFKMSILPGQAALAGCPTGSRGEEFLRYLESIVVYLYQPGELFLNLAGDGGTMRFTPVVPGN